MSTAAENELLERVAKMLGLSVTQYLMLRTVPDSLMRDLVEDGRRGISQSASMLPDQRSKPVERGTGWVEPRPVRPPDGAEPGGLIDQMVEADTQRQRQVTINTRLAELQQQLEREQAQRDKDLDPTGQLYGPYDDDNK
jgi:hypothetical protein